MFSGKLRYFLLDKKKKISRVMSEHCVEGIIAVDAFQLSRSPAEDIFVCGCMVSCVRDGPGCLTSSLKVTD